MKRTLVFSILAVFVALTMATLSGCSGKGAPSTSLIFGGIDKANPKFAFLDRQFRGENAFSPEESADLIQHQSVILALLEDARSESQAATLDLAAMKFLVRNLSRHVDGLKEILSQHIELYDEGTQIIYHDALEDIEYLFTMCNQEIQQAEEGEVDWGKVEKYAGKLVDAIGPLLKDVVDVAI